MLLTIVEGDGMDFFLNPCIRKESIAFFLLELGFFLSACKRVGLYKHVGYDINPYERDFAISKGIEPSKYTLATDKFKLSGKYDAIYSTEVFEHMTDAELKKVMPILYKACNKYFYFTSTPFTSTIPEWDIEWGHINIKQKDEWIALFKKHGFDYMRDANEVTSWGLLFTKNENHGKRK